MDAEPVTSGNVRNNQDQRIVTDASGNAYLVFDNGVQGGKGTVLYVAKSTDGGPPGAIRCSSPR